MKKLVLGLMFVIALLLVGGEAEGTLATFCVKTIGVVILALTAWGFHVEFENE